MGSNEAKRFKQRTRRMPLSDGGRRFERRAFSVAVALLLSLLTAPAHAAGALNLIPAWPELVAIGLAFLILIYPLNALLFKPLFGVLDEREERIAGARRRGKALQDQAEEVLGRYQESVREVREQAEQDRRSQLDAARGEHVSITDQARGEADGEVERGRNEIRSSLEAARQQLRDASGGLAREAAARILGRSLS